MDFLKIIKEGRSFSGRERHCSFLNLGQGQFADVSAISGFDYPDDGRGIALTDWDSDGDQDIWIANRTSPQIRLLVNDAPQGHHYVTVRLQGSTSNRDAIGARVLLYLSRSDAPISRTVRAGDAFLSQSSKTLTFGLGSETTVDRLEVNWPGADAQTFRIEEVDCEYQIVQGKPEAVKLPRRTPVTLTSENLAAKKETEQLRSLCFSMIHFPDLEFSTESGHKESILRRQSRLVLVNLWASWCAPCLEELNEFESRKQELDEEGIDVLALNVDALPGGGNRKVSGSQIRIPFRSGRADAAMIERMQLLHDNIFELHTPLPLPSSFLLDRKGRVTAVYKGPISVDQLLTDSRILRNVKTTQEWRFATTPFRGRWIMPPRRRHLFDLVEQLADAGHFDACQIYVKNNEHMLSTHPRWQQLLSKIHAGSFRD